MYINLYNQLIAFLFGKLIYLSQSLISNNKTLFLAAINSSFLLFLPITARYLLTL